MSAQKFPVTFLGGYSARKGVLGLIAIPDEIGDAEFCRMYSYNNGQWGRVPQDFDFTCRSITYLSEEKSGYKAWWALGKNGEVIEVKGGVASVDDIPGAGLNVPDPYGYMSVIRNIGGELYACGYGRQVYQRRGQWTSIADPILTRETARGFLDMDGSGHDALYAVGYHGEIYFYDGTSWQPDDAPTTEHLTGVRCVGPDDVWVCGRNGVVLHGRYNRWQVIHDSAFTGNWWCVEEFGGRIYLASNTGLAYIDGVSIRPVDVGLDRSITTHRLHACDGLLWSIGVKDILVFDGQTWQEVVHPGNA
jgi:hypothetical protein